MYASMSVRQTFAAEASLPLSGSILNTVNYNIIKCRVARNIK